MMQFLLSEYFHQKQFRLKKNFNSKLQGHLAWPRKTTIE